MKRIYVETKVRGLKVEAQFEQVNDYAYSEEKTGRRGQRVINIYLLEEDMPKNKKEAKQYIQNNF